MHRRWTVNTTRVVGCAVLACCLAEPSDEPPTVVSLCTLAERADEFNGRLVRVEGRIVLGPEAFLLHEEGCDSLWLTMAGASPSHTSVSEVPAEPGDQVAVGSRGMDFVHALRRDEVRSYLDSQTWALVPPMAEIEPRRDDTWERFLTTVRAKRDPEPGVECIGCMRYSVDGTLEGRFEDELPGQVIRKANGKIVPRLYGGGFGHLSSFRSQLVVSRVLSFSSEEQ
jgi:hypothetical protein